MPRSPKQHQLGIGVGGAYGLQSRQRKDEITDRVGPENRDAANLGNQISIDPHEHSFFPDRHGRRCMITTMIARARGARHARSA